MDLKSADANLAYANALKRASLGGGGLAAADAGQKGSNFADMIQDVISASSESLAKSEAVTAEAIQSTPELVDVVTAVTNAEVTLQTVVAIRDRVVTAYQEIMRMPV